MAGPALPFPAAASRSSTLGRQGVALLHRPLRAPARSVPESHKDPGTRMDSSTSWEMSRTRTSSSFPFARTASSSMIMQ
jgi:hypothetical protein